MITNRLNSRPALRSTIRSVVTTFELGSLSSIADSELEHPSVKVIPGYWRDLDFKIDGESEAPKCVPLPVPTHGASEKLDRKSAFNLHLKPTRQPKQIRWGDQCSQPDVPVELPERTSKRDRTRTVARDQAPQAQTEDSGFRIRIEVYKASRLLLHAVVP
jgi:hypothetical protein